MTKNVLWTRVCYDLVENGRSAIAVPMVTEQSVAWFIRSIVSGVSRCFVPFPMVLFCAMSSTSPLLLYGSVSCSKIGKRLVVLPSNHFC